MNKTQVIADLTDRLNDRYSEGSRSWSKSDVRLFLEELEELVVDGLKDDGTVVVGDVARIRLVQTPARPAGQYPGFGGELKQYPKRPASTKLRIAMPKKLKDRVL